MNKGDPLRSGSLKSSLKQDIVEIIVAKDTSLVVLQMTGPYADYALPRDLAEKAYLKLP
ncbi:MAG TPA: hypothetical protein HA272_00220 [Methanoregula sp.]|nr:hypothetical protein [Methanoregula sp.]